MKLQLGNKEWIVHLANRHLFTFKKYSPEILMITGVTGVVTSTVMACKATLKCEALIDEAKNKVGQINYCWAEVQNGSLDVEKYTETDKNKDLTIAYVQTAYAFSKLYGPSIIIGVASISCILGAHGIMKRRNVAMAAAYKLLDSGFKAYRQRVIEEYGEEKDYMYNHGLRAETMVEKKKNKDGTIKKTKKTKLAIDDPNEISPYARFFDEACTQWSPTPEYNLMFLRAQQNWYNDMLKVRGHVFLNEVYDALGIPRTSAGSVVGWKLGSGGDDYIDFGIWDNNDHKKRDFVNGYEKSILLDFNVDGLIYNLI